VVVLGLGQVGHSLPIVVISHPLSASSIYYDPWHPPCSIYVPSSLFPQSSKFSLVYLLAWHPSLHTPYISSPNHCLLFAAHAHTIATCFAVVPRLCHLILVSLSTLYMEPLLNATHPSNHSHLCNILLCTQLLYNLPLTINDISLLVSNGTNCLNLFHPI